jgi:hypothetical protein
MCGENIMAKKRTPPPDKNELLALLSNLNPVIVAKMYAIFITGNNVLLNVFKCVGEIEDTTWGNLRIVLVDRKVLTEENWLNGRRVVFHPVFLDALRAIEISVDTKSMENRYFSCYTRGVVRALRATSLKSQITEILKCELPQIERLIDVIAMEGRIEEVAVFLGDLQPFAKYFAEMSMLIGRSKVKYKITETPYEFMKRKEKEIKGDTSLRKNAPASSHRLQNQHIPFKEVSWHVLPKGKQPFQTILNYFVGLQSKHRHIEYDNTRLEKIYSLGPDTVYVGMDEFEGYVVFHFPERGVSVLECPVVGNAIYVLKGDWRQFSKLTKQELIVNYSENTIRIIHSGDWFNRLVDILVRE